MREQDYLLQTGAPNNAVSPCPLGAPAGFDKWDPAAFLVSVFIVTSQYQTQVVSELGLRAITQLVALGQGLGYVQLEDSSAGLWSLFCESLQATLGNYPSLRKGRFFLSRLTVQSPTIPGRGVEVTWKRE